MASIIGFRPPRLLRRRRRCTFLAGEEEPADVRSGAEEAVEEGEESLQKGNTFDN